MRLRQFNPVAQRSLNLIPTDVGRPISDLKTTLQLENLDYNEFAATVDDITLAVASHHGRLAKFREAA